MAHKKEKEEKKDHKKAPMPMVKKEVKASAKKKK